MTSPTQSGSHSPPAFREDNRGICLRMLEVGSVVSYRCLVRSAQHLVSNFGWPLMKPFCYTLDEDVAHVQLLVT